MRIPFLRAANRLTGVSTPIFGVSWNPPELDVDVAKELITALEDKRMLHEPMAWKASDYVVMSVQQVRVELNAVLKRVDRSSPLGESALAMRAACRKFLTRVGPEGFSSSTRVIGDTRVESNDFMAILGELRGVFGIHVARISAAYGIDVEDDLAAMLPEDTADDES